MAKRPARSRAGRFASFGLVRILMSFTIQTNKQEKYGKEDRFGGIRTVRTIRADTLGYLQNRHYIF